MEIAVQYLVALLLFPLSLVLIFLFGKRRSDRLNLPPGKPGWPVLGENIQFRVSGAEKFVNDRMKKYSQEVFQTSLLGEKVVIFCGDKGNKHVFTNENKLFSSWLPQSITKTIMSPDYAQSSTKKLLSGVRRSFLQGILKPDALKQYVPVMDELAREHIEKEWAPHDQVKVYPLTKKYTFDLACRLFMSVVDPIEIKKLADLFHLLTKGMISVPIDFPGTDYNGAIKGGKMVREELYRIIKERKKELMMEDKEIDGRDLLSRILSLMGEEGQFMSEMDISNYMVGLLIPSHDTTSSTITCVFKHLAELPHIYNEVLKEQIEINKTKGPNELLTWEDIQKMKYTWNVICESMRIMPPAHGFFRETITEFTYAGFTIPKGWKTFWTVHTTHKNPKYFPDPEKFDPSRFEGSGPAPYTYVPFGGGPRMCPGKEYAKLAALVFLHNAVRKFKFEKLIPNEKIVYHASPVPTKGFPVSLHPHKI